MVHQWGFFGSISAIRKIWSLTANSRSLQAAALKIHEWKQLLRGMEVIPYCDLRESQDRSS